MISLYDILQASNGQLFGEPAAQLFSDFCTDAARATPNAFFIALKGDWGDTHRHMQEAIQRGASGVLCMRPPDFDTTGVSVVLVRDTTQAILLWARYIMLKSSVKTIAIAGSSGKTMAVEAVRRVLATRYAVLAGDVDSADNRLSIPLALARLTAAHQWVVFRLDTAQPGDMNALLSLTQPQTGVVLNIDPLSPPQFENIDQFTAEQRRLVEHLNTDQAVILNYDDDRVRSFSSAARAKTITVGVDNFGATLMAYNVVAGLQGTGFDVRYGSERHIGKWIPLLGKHQLYGVLAALAVGLQHNIPLDEGLRALSDLKPLPGRMNPLMGIDDCLLIDDTHSATPQSTIAALDWVAHARDPQQRVIFVLGDLDALGAQSQVGHRQVGQHTVGIADVLITEGIEAAGAGRAALDQGMPAAELYTTFSNVDSIAALKSRLRLTAHDVVVVKGGAARRMERVVQALLKNQDEAQLLTRQTTDMLRAVTFQPTRPTWVELDTDALAANVRAIKAIIGQQVALMAVVKADAYGHGAVTTSQTALLNGASYLAVANLEEALELREAGITAPILILSYTPVYSVREVVRQNLTVTLYDLDMARAYDHASGELGRKLRVHVKVDTGMGRLGVMPGDTLTLFRHLMTLKHIEIEGIYTHFSAADDDPMYTAEQVVAFKNVLRPLRGSGIQFKYIHAANSAGMLTVKDDLFNMVRCGIALYGLHPSQKVRLPEAFKPVMTWKTVVAQVKTLPAGHMVGYGNSYRTQREETVAILPIGYGDGF
ncbi:MAG: alanine racemase, partial [Armatimonadetes bacterium]|nr:alanine racemase [Anaerolineae bacterium]